MHRACRWLIVAALATTCAAGCSAEAHRYIRFPNFSNPGPAAVQRADAIQHDPYPLNDIGPEIVGGRPLAYQQSVPEVVRENMTPAPNVSVQPLLPLGSTVMAPPVVSSPYAVAPPQTGMPLVSNAPPVVTSAFPPPGAPIGTTTIPAAPAPVVTGPPYSAPPPVIAPTYPVAPVPRPSSYQNQPRAPY